MWLWISLAPLVSPEMFHLAVPVIEKMLRPIIVYVFLVAALRIRQAGARAA